MSYIALVLTHTNLYFSALYAETVTNGIYSVLFVLCLIKLARDNSTPPRKGLKMLLLCLTVIMFCVGTAHSAIFLQQALSSAQGVKRADPQTHARYEYTKLSLEVVNCFLGDLIIISTALTLEKVIGKTKSRSRSHLATLYAVPTLLLVASLVAGIGMVCTCGGADVLSSILSPVQRGWPSAWISLVLATNLVSTLVFVYEFVSRCLRKELKADNMTVIGGSLKEFFITLMCSGALYCCTFIVLLVLFMIDCNARYIVNHMIPQLAGIYPTATIVIVAFSTNDPSIQLSPISRSINKQSSRRFHEDLPPVSPTKRTRSTPPSSPHGGSRMLLPPFKGLLTRASCSPRRAFEWCRSKLRGPHPIYPRKDSSNSTATLKGSVRVTVDVERIYDEPYVPKRTTSLPLHADLRGLNDYKLETFNDERTKQRLSRLADPDEDGVSPLEAYIWAEEGPYRRSTDQGGGEFEFFWWKGNTSMDTVASFPREHTHGGSMAEAV
ncbi:unnamed protein product [Peniophora sp. CBMAI 1063]|nr:unnamed protein product [Peniophora sp. CBMAI 1063]